MRSRRPADNPFSSHRIEALPYRARGVGSSDLLDRVARIGGRAAIVGPEGSGKTTLLEELAARCNDRSVIIRLPGNCARPLQTAVRKLPRPIGEDHAIFVDGSEQLGWFAWLRFTFATRRARTMVATQHEAGRLPTLIECRTDVGLLQELVAELAPDLMDELEPELPGLFARHSGNIRLCLRELYDVCAGRRHLSS